jgi:hypothetical protein
MNQKLIADKSPQNVSKDPKNLKDTNKPQNIPSKVVS